MADVLTSTPSKRKTIEVMGQKVMEGSLEQEYLLMIDPNSPTCFEAGKKYMFELANKNPPREIPPVEVLNNRSYPIKERGFNAYQNIVFSSQIVWNGQRTVIRYYDGCESLFVSQQPREKEVIELLINQTKRRAFLEGKFGCYGDERMLLLYMMICSWNAKSPFRTRIAPERFIALDKTKQATAEGSRLDAIEEALKNAKEASEKKMLIHAAYLGIPEKDFDSGNDLTPDEIRIEYRKAASADPIRFNQSFGNKSIETKYYIRKALQTGILHNKHNPNELSWEKSNRKVCEITGLKSMEAIEEKAFEFSQLSEGEEFVIQLHSVFQ